MSTYYINGSGALYIGTQGTYGIGSDATGSGSLATPWATLNKAVSSGSANDIVYVAQASYPEAWVDSKGLSWIADGTVTVVAAAANVFSSTGGNVSVTGFIFQGSGTATYGVRTSGAGNQTFTDCTNQNMALGGSCAYITGTGTFTWIRGTCSGSNNLAAVFYRSGAATVVVTGTTITAAASRIYLDNDSAGTATFTDLNVSMATPASAYAFNLFATGNVLIDGGTYTFTGSMASFIRLANGAGSGALTVVNNPVVNTSAMATSNPIINITAGAHIVNISVDIITSNPSQVQDIIYIVNQPAPRVHHCTIDTRGNVGDVNNTCPHIRITSTGTTVGAARIDHNTSYSTNLYGSIYLVGNDVTGAGDGKCNGGELDNNKIFGALYYDRNIAVTGTHALEFAWSSAGKIHHNYVNGMAYGPIIKGNGTDYAGADGIYDNLCVNVGGSQAGSALGSLYVKGAQNVPVYNNTSILAAGYKSANGLLHVYTNNDTGSHFAASAIVKNNIFVCDGTVPLVVVGTAGDALDNASIVSDYNLYYSYGDAFYAKVGAATTYATFAAWQAAGYDANGMFTDPKFVNSSAGKFYLRYDSPCIGSGISLAEAYSLSLDRMSIWPDIVLLLAQGQLWDIGSYKYRDANLIDDYTGTIGIPVRQQLVSALAARLATITTANGYRTNIGLNVQEWDLTPLDPDLSALLVEYRDEAGTTAYAAVGEHLHTLPVSLRVRCQNNAAGGALDTVRDAVADIYQAIYSDVTFGGLAQDTNQEGSIKENKGEAGDTAAGAQVVYTIEYTTEPGSP